MKIAYVLPGVVASAPGGKEKMAERLHILRKITYADNAIDIYDISHGPASIESMYEEYLSIPSTAERMLELEKLGYDAAILGCFGDPGLDGIREVIHNMIIVAPAESSYLLASMCGYRFSVITATDSLTKVMSQLARRYGLEGRLASVRAVNIPVLDLQDNKDLAMSVFHQEAEKAVQEDGADTLVIGCMSLAFLAADHQLVIEAEAPVINPVMATVKVAESLGAMGLVHSKVAFPTPPKMR